MSPKMMLVRGDDEVKPRLGTGLLVVNADDWGQDVETTDRILECVNCGAVSSVSSMVFMEDSTRAAAVARERMVNSGLHLNLTTPFTAPDTPAALVRHQSNVSAYLRRHRLAQILFHPGLVSSFKYVVAAQLEEYARLYGKDAESIDGHHHMHLCANVIYSKLLPEGTVVRGNFTFERGEKSLFNRVYRRTLDRVLRRRHVVPDFLYSIAPVEPLERLPRLFSLARTNVVEIETHPVNPEEYRFLREDFSRLTTGLRIGPRLGAGHRQEPISNY